MASRRPPDPPVFSRRSFLFFIVLAPACLLAVAAIVLTLQYKQFRTMVSPASAVEEFVPTEADVLRLAALENAFAVFASSAPPLDSATASGTASASAADTTGSTGYADSLRLSPHDLTLLAAASPVARGQGLRFRFADGDSLITVESARRVDALQGRVAWVFRRITPIADGWLNARMEGLPVWKARALSFEPEKGYLNGAKVPRAALSKRGGLSPKDFLDPRHEPAYTAFLAAIDTVVYVDGNVVIVRRK